MDGVSPAHGTRTRSRSRGAGDGHPGSVPGSNGSITLIRRRSTPHWLLANAVRMAGVCLREGGDCYGSYHVRELFRGVRMRIRQLSLVYHPTGGALFDLHILTPVASIHSSIINHLWRTKRHSMHNTKSSANSLLQSKSVACPLYRGNSKRKLSQAISFKAAKKRNTHLNDLKCYGNKH